jgi:membrane peptidoglycan carboxypeptidase
MNDLPKGPAGRRRRAGNTYTTSSGKTLKLNQSISERRKANKFSRDTLKATYLSTLPKNKFLRALHRLHPRHIAAYWFSREGAIMALKIAGVGVVICFFLVIGVFAYFRKDLPKIKNISGDKLGGSITYLDKTGTTVLFQDYDAVKRVPVADENISPYIKQATVAIEDKDFYKHGAFDVRGITRAATHDIVGGGGAVQGGSTITQQLVKLNEQWTTNRTITRKVKELILAVELEREYTKQDILTAYLNIAPYGGIEYGIETAARDYFHTTAKDLTLAQASMLAAIPQSPYHYSPYSSPSFNAAVSSEAFDKEALIGRQHYILDQMVAQKMITPAQATEAKQVDVLAQIHPLESKYQGIKAPYFVLAAKQELERKYGAATVQRSGWVVTTTLDMNLQTLAETQVAKDLPAIHNYKGNNAAFAAEDVQTGQMVALVGGVEFSNKAEGGLINYAQTPLPPGSSFKPYDYASLINYTPAGAGSVFYDTQGPLPGYPCTNKNSPKTDKTANCLWDYDFQYPGPLTLRYALGGSRNVPAIKAMLSVVPNDQIKSVNKVISTAESMQSDGKGFGYNCYADTSLTKKTQCYGSSAIGDGAFLHLDEHVNGLATMSRLGSYIPQTYIMKIVNGSGKTINQWKQPNGKQVIKDEAAYIVNDMLSDPNASYLPGSFKFQHQKNGWKFAVKTGTTNDNYDGLMTSWSTKYAVATWVGTYARNVTLRGSMENVTEPIVRGWMEGAHAGLKPVNWTAPATLKTLPAFIIRNHVGIGSVEPSPSVDLFPSWYQAKSNTNVAQTIDKVSGKLATSCTPAAAKLVQNNSNTSSFSIDRFVAGGAAASSTSVSGNDDVHNCDDEMPHLSITSAGNKITLTASQGTHPLSGGSYTADSAGSITVTANGQTICTLSIDNPSLFSGSCDYTPTGNDPVQLTAVLTDSVLYQDSQTGTLTPTTNKKNNGNNNN